MLKTKQHNLESFIRIAKFRSRLYKILTCKEQRGVLDLETVEDYTERINDCDSFILKNKKAMGFLPFQRVII